MHDRAALGHVVDPSAKKAAASSSPLEQRMRSARLPRAYAQARPLDEKHTWHRNVTAEGRKVHRRSEDALSTGHAAGEVLYSCRLIPGGNRERDVFTPHIPFPYLHGSVYRNALLRSMLSIPRLRDAIKVRTLYFR